MYYNMHVYFAEGTNIIFSVKVYYKSGKWLSQEDADKSMQTCGTYRKNKNLKKQQVLYVKMFGDFSLEYQGISLIAKKKKETQFAQVLQLIFHSGEEGISREHLEKVLFGERTLDDANHAIHSLIYNIRKKLEQTGLSLIHI